VRWADKNKITIPQYQGVQAYTSELLDTCMEYKTNIARLQAVLRNPKDYVMSSVPEAISTKAAALVDQRKQMQTQMGLIVKEIDILLVSFRISPPRLYLPEQQFSFLTWKTSDVITLKESKRLRKGPKYNHLRYGRQGYRYVAARTRCCDVQEISISANLS